MDPSNAFLAEKGWKSSFLRRDKLWETNTQATSQQKFDLIWKVSLCQDEEQAKSRGASMAVKQTTVVAHCTRTCWEPGKMGMSWAKNLPSPAMHLFYTTGQKRQWKGHKEGVEEGLEPKPATPQSRFINHPSKCLIWNLTLHEHIPGWDAITHEPFREHHMGQSFG